MNEKDSIYNSHGSVTPSIGQPTTIEDKANDSISAGKMVSSQFKNRLETSQDMEYLDNSTGGNGIITGQTASIKFTRSDDKTKSFLMQKRAGVTNTQNNVFELYPIKANLNAFNYIYIGVDGMHKDVSVNSYVELGANIDTTKSYSSQNGAIVMALNRNGVATAYSQVSVVDARSRNSSNVGVDVELIATGNDGIVALQTESGSQAIVVARTYISIIGLPTSNPGGSGILWNSAGTLKIT